MSSSGSSTRAGHGKFIEFTGFTVRSSKSQTTHPKPRFILPLGESSSTGYKWHDKTRFPTDPWGDEYNTIGLQISTKKKGSISDACRKVQMGISNAATAIHNFILRSLSRVGSTNSPFAAHRRFILLVKPTRPPTR